MSTVITITNPWTGAIIERDITGLQQRDLDAWANTMDDDERDRINDIAPYPCTPEQWMALYASEYGPEATGIIVLGS